MSALERGAVIFVATCILLPLAAVAWRAGAVEGFGQADWAALRFTLWQAVLSATLSILLAVPVARALARRRFRGRRALVVLLGAPFILPVIVAVLGLLAVFGRSGLVNEMLELAGLPEMRIYGLHGVVLAHVFFNLPLATRMILQGWQSIPGERFRLSASLGMQPWQVFRLLELQMLRAILPGAWMVIFALCLSSFAVALTLGGGPKATTLELGIYQAFRYDFDLGRAAILAILQLGLAMGAAVVALKLAAPAGFGAGLDRVVRRYEAETLRAKVVDTIAISAATLFLLTPLAMLVIDGARGLPLVPWQVAEAAVISVAIAICASVLCVGLALAMARRGEMVGYLGLAVSPMVIGTGLFLLINPVMRPMALAFPVTVLVNALMALPFAVRVLGPELRLVEADWGRLGTALDMRGRDWLRWVVLPRLRRSIGFAAGLAAALSMGDLGVVALFADPDWATLPLQMYRLMDAYQMRAAAGAGLILLALSLALFWVFDRGGQGDAEA